MEKPGIPYKKTQRRNTTGPTKKYQRHKNIKGTGRNPE